MFQFKKSTLVVSLVAGLVAQTNLGGSGTLYAGEGRSGPDTNGVSIPAGQDRTYSVDFLKKTEGSCFKQLADRVYRTLTKGAELPKEAYFDAKSVNFLGPSQAVLGSAGYPFGYGCNLHISKHFSYSPGGEVWNTLNLYDSVISIEVSKLPGTVGYPNCPLLPGTDRAWLKYQTTQPVIYVRFSQFHADVKYNEYGMVDASTLSGQNVVIENDEGSSKTTEVHIISQLDENGSELVRNPLPSKLTIDTQSYADCLKAGLNGSGK